MHIHYFQHVPFEGLGCIADWINTHQHRLTATRWFEPDADTSEAANADMIIIMGGPMGVYEVAAYPWLTEEINIVKSAVAKGKKVLGICLGSQVLAAALDANVYPHTQQEIGWFPIDFTFQDKAAQLLGVLPQHMIVFHWHGDTFDIPAGATRFAASAACSNQAYIFNNAIGLQFHLELTPDSLQDMLKNGIGEIAAGGAFIQHQDTILQHQELLTDTNNTLIRLLDYLAAK
ncbi:gamma-glutamyl-gamma-aminobutyrate hydrolase family protein [Chitinophaga sp. Cy-1792]|uniref:glutamine amidotransferase-related protein n=1 Tax=Chitinophaga sp. Cy-1792 TaxID=2608339 RepID=UPI00141FC085|nr:gamma-glutamyl-gamma-aminobutyrate hydrolase family protein [Chitinophaga sp. Cy-1792]NIG53504.1 amidotransferase [Chitinophaga sp. Cy-1792]